ncbi:MAG: LysM peptidoglycan-binding domain-containing protein [Desulfuromonadales bacterium]|nr:LysM peptidoglycan-binding domain-containing protein [Desulfuromonadales bacterium]
MFPLDRISRIITLISRISALAKLFSDKNTQKVTSNLLILFLGLIAALVALPAYAAMDPNYELDPQALGVAVSPARKKSKSDKQSVGSRPLKHTDARVPGPNEYVVKSGDNLFKILMRDYNLSNNEAVTFIELICRENNITDIRHLKVGKKIIIPPLQRKASKASKGGQQLQGGTARPGSGGHTFRLESPETTFSELEANLQIRKTWDKMMPPPASGQLPVMIQSPLFSLALDPHRYPVYAAMGNGRILVDKDASIPPLVKNLIAEKDPSLRIVTESPLNGRRFLSAMLASAGFYSVEENFSMDFGSDPKLTVRSDFKVEKTPESIIKQDLVLINSGRTQYPSVISEFLKKEGLTVYEPFASHRPVLAGTSGQVCQITSRKLSEIVDGLLALFSITPDKDKRLDVFANDNNGISLSVKAERYFERGGQRHVVTRFDGDPITYTLYRLLESKGYQVIILEAQDDFRKVTEKLLSRIRINGTYASHRLGPVEGVNYSLRMSGFKLEGAGLPTAGIFLTNLEMDPVIRDLLTENGYSITVR